jgi:putative DNA primase/helicase
VAPLHLVEAPQPGTGKSYLANLAALIATGKPCAVIAVDKTLEETEKRLIGAILCGHPIISIDNARQLLEGPILCQAIEQPLLELRRLGSSDMFEVANAITLFANGNNLTIADDLVRRIITCQLDANEESPETRSFRADPALMVQRNRGAYVAACLTVVRAYLAAGLPGRLTPLPSFGAWSDRVRSALVWLGCADPVLTMVAAARKRPPPRRLCLFRTCPAARVHILLGCVLLDPREAVSGRGDDDIAAREGVHQLLKQRPLGRDADNLLAEHLFAPGRLQLGKLADEVLGVGRDPGTARRERRHPDSVDIAYNRAAVP